MAQAGTTLVLGDNTFDISARAVIMGILNRTPDSFYDRGATFELDVLLERAESLVLDGADLLDVGGVKAGPGPDVSEAEELDRVVGTVAALHARFDVPLSVDTWRASGSPTRPTVRVPSWETTSAASQIPDTSTLPHRPARLSWRRISGSPRG